MYLCTTREVHRCTNRECTTHALKSGPVHKSRSAPLHISKMYQTQIKKCTCAQIKKCTAAQIETVPDTNQEVHLRTNQEVYLCTNREVCQVGRVLHAADWSEPQNTFPAVMQRPNIYINFQNRTNTNPTRCEVRRTISGLQREHVTRQRTYSCVCQMYHVVSQMRHTHET